MDAVYQEVVEIGAGLLIPTRRYYGLTKPAQKLRMCSPLLIVCVSEVKEADGFLICDADGWATVVRREDDQYPEVLERIAKSAALIERAVKEEQTRSAKRQSTGVAVAALVFGVLVWLLDKPR